MERFFIEQTDQTPGILIDAKEGIIEITGRSIPEIPLRFYDPVFEQLDEYAANAPQSTTVNFKIDYFDTTSFKCIWGLFEKLEKIKHSGIELEINWYYEKDDEEMRDIGSDFERQIKIPINLEEVEELY